MTKILPSVSPLADLRGSVAPPRQTPPSRGGASRTVFERPEREVRAKLTPAQYSMVLMLQGGVCAHCKGRGPFEADHIMPLSMGGTNELFNWQLLCDTCHQIKTNCEAGPRAKAERQAGRKGQYARRLKNGAQIKGRGFDKRLRKHMDGTVEPR